MPVKFGNIDVPDYEFFLGIVEERLKRLERQVDPTTEFQAGLRRAQDLVAEIRLFITGRIWLGDDFWEAIAVRSFRLGSQLHALGIPLDEQKEAATLRRAGGKAAGDTHRRKGSKTAKSVLKIALGLLGEGRKPHELASIIAEQTGLSDRRVRDHLNIHREQDNLPT